MKCSIIQKKLSAYLDKEVSDEESKFIKEHLKSCPICQRELQMLTHMNAELKRIKGVEVPPYFYTRLKQRIVDEKVRIPVLKKFWRFSLPGFAAVFILAAFLLGNTMAKTIYQGITGSGVTTQTANVFGVEVFDQYPENSPSNIYYELLTGAEQ